MKPPASTPARAEINPHALANVVKVQGGVWYQPPEGGPKLPLITSEELNELRVTQDYWIRERRREFSLANRF